MIAHAEADGLDVTVSGTSPWNPGATFSITFTRRTRGAPSVSVACCICGRPGASVPVAFADRTRHVWCDRCVSEHCGPHKLAEVDQDRALLADRRGAALAWLRANWQAFEEAHGEPPSRDEPGHFLAWLIRSGPGGVATHWPAITSREEAP